MTLNLNVILMVTFMVAAIHFLKNLLLWLFTKILTKVENKIRLSLTFMGLSAILSAFLDALTVTAVLVSVCTGFLGVYYYVEKNSFLPLVRPHLFGGGGGWREGAREGERRGGEVR